jgi:hypothetical protein
LKSLNAQNYDRPDQSLAQPNNLLFFEKTPSYLFLRRTPQLIRSICPWTPKIIVILRNPVDRAFSHFRMDLRTGGKSFEDLIDQEIDNMRVLGLSNAPRRTSNYLKNDTNFQIPNLTQADSDSLNWRHYRRIFTSNYLQRSEYHTQISLWDKYFPLHDKMLVVNYERFALTPEAVFHEILEFVGAPPFIPAGGFDTQHNSNRSPESQLKESTRRYLEDFFRPYNNLLADTLGEDWRGVWDLNGVVNG